MKTHTYTVSYEVPTLSEIARVVLSKRGDNESPYLINDLVHMIYGRFTEKPQEISVDAIEIYLEWAIGKVDWVAYDDEFETVA